MLLALTDPAVPLDGALQALGQKHADLLAREVATDMALDLDSGQRRPGRGGLVRLRRATIAWDGSVMSFSTG